jgi:hypothetical protein
MVMEISLFPENITKMEFWWVYWSDGGGGNHNIKVRESGVM